MSTYKDRDTIAQAAPEGDDRQFRLRPLATDLAGATIEELLSGSFEYSNKIWGGFFGCQKSLLDAATQSFGKDDTLWINKTHNKTYGGEALRRRVRLACYDRLTESCLDVLTAIYACSSNLHKYTGDHEAAAKCSAKVALLNAITEDLGAEADDVLELSVNTLEFLDGYPAYIRNYHKDIDDIGNALSYFIDIDWDVEVAADTQEVNRMAESGESADDGQPQHPSNVITRIVNELLAGYPSRAIRQWDGILSHLQRSVNSYISRSDERLLERLAHAQILTSEDLAVRREEVFRRLDEMAELYVGGLRHTYLKLISISASDRFPDLAYRYFKRLFSLHEVTDCLNEESISQMATIILLSQEREIYCRNISADSLAGANVLARLQELNELTASIEGVADYLRAERLNPTWCNQLCERISHLFIAAPPVLQQSLKHRLLDIFRDLKVKRESLMRPENPSDPLELTWALLYVNKALRGRTGTKPYETFHDCFEFHNTVRCQPEVLQNPEVFQDLQSAMRAGRIAGERVVKASSFKSQLESNPKRYSYVYSRLGEICRAHAVYDCGSPSELAAVLELGVTAFTKSLTPAVHLEPAHLLFTYQRLAECLRRLNRPLEAIEYYRKVLDLHGASSFMRWETNKFIAICLQMQADVIKNDDKGHAAAADLYSEAEYHLCEAARVWEPESDLSQDSCNDMRNMMLHGQLAWLYLSWGKFVRAEQQTKMSQSCLEKYSDPLKHKNYWHLIKYLLGLSLARQGRNEEAIDVLERLLKDGITSKYRAKALGALKELYVTVGNYRRVEHLNAELLRTGKEVEHNDILSLTSEQEVILADYSEMSKYVVWCKDLLERGEIRALINELPSLVAASKFLWKKGKPDSVLLTILASAYMEAGNYGAACEAIDEAFGASKSTKNQGICWLKKGDIFLRQGKFVDAAECYENSYSLGGRRLSALLKAANARRRVGDYSKALEHLEAITNSGLDKMPAKTATELTRVLWDRFCDPSKNAGDADIRRACGLIRRVLLGEFGYVGDSYAALQLVRMAAHPIATDEITKLLRYSRFTVQVMLIRMLERERVYGGSLVEAAISLIPKDDHPITHRRRSAYRAAAGYIMGSWVNAYVNWERDRFSAYVKRTVELMLDRTQSPSFWASLLAGNRSTMTAYVSKQIYDTLSSLLMTYSPKNIHDILEHLRNIGPQLHAHLETNLLGLLAPAYAGREEGRPLLSELMEVVGYWLAISSLRDKVSRQISVDSPGQCYVVTDFQRYIAVSFLNQFVKQIADGVLPPEQLKGVALRLEQSEEYVFIKVRLSFADDLPQSACEECAEAIKGMSFLRKWRSATAALLPALISAEFRPAQRDMVITISLWRSQLCERGQWKWDKVYSYVMEKGSETYPTRSYYFDVNNYLREVLPVEAEELASFALVNLDGLFVQTYKSSGKTLRPILHTIKNTLMHLPEADVWDEEARANMAVEVQRLYKALAKIGPTLMKEFDFRKTLADVVSESKIFYPDIFFEFEYAGPNEAVVNGSRHHIMTAIWDIIHNSVDAIRQSSGGNPKRVRISLAHMLSDVEIVIANTGSPLLDVSKSGFGIGSQNVEYVIGEQHGGRVSHGPIHADKRYRYEWRLLFPLAPISRRRR